MNWAALRHLCWVLLILNGVSGGEEEQSSRPATPVRLRRPIRRNSIKKSSEDDFKPSVFPDDPSSTTGSTRFTTKRTNAADYLARNTVPVASVTETSRKPYRPAPAHLLTYQALSSTEKGSDRTNEPNLPPTGWALASLGPSKNSSQLVSKKNNIPLGTTRPLTSYWSTRLRRPPALRTTPIPPVDSKESSEDVIGSAGSVIPAENLIKDENNATASHPKLFGDFQGSLKESAPAPSITERENVLEKPSNIKKLELTSSQTYHATTDNTRNNLIKELRGGDIGSKILHGIVAVTNASEYSDVSIGHHGSEEKQNSSTQSVGSGDLHKPQDDANVVDDKVQIVTRKSEYGTTPSIKLSSNATTPLMEASSHPATSTFSKETSQTTSSSTSSEETFQATTSEEKSPTSTSTSSERTSQTTTAAQSISTASSKETSQSTSSVESSQEKETSLFPSEESEIQFELPTDKVRFTDRITSFTEGVDSKEIVSNETTSSKPTRVETVEEKSSTGKLDEASVSTSFSTSTETEAAITASVSESSLVPVIANVTPSAQDEMVSNKTEPQKFTTLPSIQETVNTATTVAQEANDIPEAYTRIKNNPYIEKSSSEGFDEVVSPTSTPLTTKATSNWDETSKPFTVGTSSKFTTSASVGSTSASIGSTSATVGSTLASVGSTKTTTELMDTGMPTSTQSILETTNLPVLKNGKPETENETATTWGTLPATDVSKEEVTSRSSVEMPTTTVKIQMQTTARSESSWSNPATTESAVDVAETTTQYDLGRHKDISTTSTEYVHIGLSEKPDDDHDDTLKYNVTTVDHPHGNGTDPDESDEDPEDETEKEIDVHTTTTLVIIEEITTTKPTTTRLTTVPMPTTKVTTQQPSTTTGGDVGQDVRPPTTGKTPESSNEPRLRLTFQASFKEMCLVRDSLAETIAAYFKSVSTRPIQSNQVKILNLGMTECASKSLPLTEKVPVFVQITDSEGKGDQNLTEVLYSYIKQSPFNFKYPLAHVEHGQKPLIMEEDNQWGGTVIAAIFISSVAGVSLLCLTILLVIMRKRQKGFTYGQRCTPVSLEDYSLDNISVFNSVRRKAMRASKRSYGNPAFDDPVTVTNPLNFVGLSNMANSHQKIDSEYSEVPTVTVKPDELPPGAECKNRYANVIPIPETRVPLQGPDREDLFINANYVKGVKGAEKFYIACQAPLESTIADFWMMIWEQQSQVILMLTDLHENGVEKCADYLPPSEVLDCHRVFGDLQVTLKKREVREKYIISSLQLRNLESNLWREVIHLWYTGWPIRGVPEDLPSIIAYLIEARSYSKPGHPIVVHCSPGTGRTGTVIAIDIAIRDFETDRTVDIPRTVYGIRRDRAGAVQTNLQYYMIYQVIHLYATKLTGGSLDSI